MAKLANRAKMGTSTTGTGTITLGSAKAGFLSFADAGISDGDVVRYVIEDGDAFEIGTGTYTASGTTLSRTVSESSNSDAAIDLSGNNEVSVFIAATKDDFVNAGEGGTFTGDVTFSGTLTGDLTGTADKADQAYVQVANQSVQATHYILGMSGTASNGYKDIKYESGITFNPVTDSLSADSFRAKNGGFFAIQDSGGTYYTNLKAVGPTAFRDIYFPDADGTVAFNTTATTSSNGLMSSTDKTKLNGIETGATADQTGAEIKTAYEGEADTNAFTDALKTKLDGIETFADVTDTANVTAAGALMDSELTNEAAIKTIDQGLTTTSDVTFNDVVVSGDLTVSGTTTTVNTETINLADNQIVLNSNETGSPTQDGGIEIERGTETNKTLVWDETNDRWTVGSETFVAGFFSGDGSNLTNVAASTVNVSESSDDNAFYNVLFSDTTGTGNVQMAPTQDDGGLTFNPFSNVLFCNNLQIGNRIYHDGDLDTYIDFQPDEITFNAGGVSLITALKGSTTDVTQFNSDIYLNPNHSIVFEGSTADGFETSLTVTDPTADRTITLPDATGTVALTDELYTDSDVDTHLNQSSAGTNQILSWNGSDYAWVDDSDTTYSNATTSTSGLMSSTDKTKLDGIETGADVTDTANVTAAGALMDSEVTNLAQVKAFDSSDYATAAQGTTADAALPKAGGTMTGNITFAATQTFDAADLTGTLPAIDGSNLTNVQATSIYVNEATDTETDRNIIFASGAAGAADTQLEVKQDDGGIGFNPNTNTLKTSNADFYGDITVGGTITHYNDTNTQISFTDDRITLVAGGTATVDLTDLTNALIVDADIDIGLGHVISFEGSSQDNFETTLTVTNPTADRTVTLPDATGTVTLNEDFTSAASVKAIDQGLATTNSPEFAGLTISGSIADTTLSTLGGDSFTINVDGVGGEIALQTDSADRLKLSNGSTALYGLVSINGSFGDRIRFEGNTADAYETTLRVTEPTADRTITFPDATGTIAFNDVATTSANGLMSSTDKTKLDGIETGADVTDTANVTAAGALMDSEVTNLAQVKAFDSSDYAAASHSHNDLYYTETEADARFLRSDTSDTMSGNLTVDNGTSSTINVICDDGGAAGVIARGSSQGTGYVQVAQSTGYGGGMYYNGDGTPAFANGETADTIGFYRMDNGTRTEVFYYPYNGSTVTFNGSIAVGGTVDGRDVATDGTKLDGIEAGADVTDTANVTAAGALMDSECTSLASVKAIDQGLATTDEPTFAGMTLNGTLTLGAYSINDVEDIYLRDRMAHDGDIDTYIQFHATDQWRVVTGGSERLEVNSSSIISAEPIQAPSFEATSDINLKENIAPVEDAVTKISKLSGYTYNFKDDPEVPKAGLIAQEVQDVLPEAVKANDEGVLHLDYNGTIALLVEAVKDQQKQINALKKELKK